MKGLFEMVEEKMMDLKRMPEDEAVLELANAWIFLKEEGLLPKNLEQSTLKDKTLKAYDLYLLETSKRELEKRQAELFTELIDSNKSPEQIETPKISSLSEDDELKIQIKGIIAGKSIVADYPGFSDFYQEIVNMFGDNIKPYVKRIYIGLQAVVNNAVFEEMDSVYDVRHIRSEDTIATPEEMRHEAIMRMQSVIDYQPFIDEFIENGHIMVYEPPYGCGYEAEENDTFRIMTIEKTEHVLVWGIIREFPNMCFGDAMEKRDNYLFVSEDKLLWEEERLALEQLLPEAFIFTNDSTEYNREQICPYRSPGGTLVINS